MARKRDENILPTTVWVEKEDYRQLRSILVLKDKSFSQWVRIIIKDFLNKEKQMKEKEEQN